MSYCFLASKYLLFDIAERILDTSLPTLFLYSVSFLRSSATCSLPGQYLSASLRCASAMSNSKESIECSACSQSATALSIFSNLKPHLQTRILQSHIVPHFGHLIDSGNPQLLHTFLPSEISLIHPQRHTFILSFFSLEPAGLYDIFSILQKATSTFSDNFLSLNNWVSCPITSSPCSDVNSPEISAMLLASSKMVFLFE